MFVRVVLALFLACRLHAVGDDPSAMERSVRQAAELFDRVVSGDASAEKEALAAFEHLLREYPDQPVALAYWGCLVTMQAGAGGSLGERMDRLRVGFQAMDRAVELAPGDPVVRLVRGVNALQLPRAINRRPQSAEDFAVLRRWAEFEPGKLPAPLRRLALFHAGRHALRARRSDAAELFRAALLAEGDRPEPAEIEAMLARALQVDRESPQRF